MWWREKSESINHFQLTCSSVSVIESQFFFSLNKVLNILIHVRAQLLCLKQDRGKISIYAQLLCVVVTSILPRRLSLSSA